MRGAASRVLSYGCASFISAATLLSAPSPARAQIAPFTFEVRLGGSLPVEELADPAGTWPGDVGSGVSFGMNFAYTFRSWGAAYAGFSQHRYSCGPEACGRDASFEATGFDVGVRFILGSGRVVPLIRTGLVTYRVVGTMAEPGGGPHEVFSHRTLGGEAGLGLSIRLGPWLVLTPGVRYLRMEADFGANGDLPMPSVIADVGILLAF